jgi:hypothetical protein
MQLRSRLRLPSPLPALLSPSIAIILLPLLLPCLAIPALSATYYVNPSGRDTNSCLSAAQPCQTIARAESLSSPGDTFNLSGFIALSTPIAAKTGQTFVGAGTAIVSGGIQLCTATVKCSGPDRGGNWSVTGMTQQGPLGPSGVCDTGWEGCVYAEDLFVDGKPLQHIFATAIPKLTASTWWFDYPHHTIYFHLNPNGHIIRTSVTPTMFQPNCANNITIANLTIQEFAAKVGQGAAIDPNYGQNPSPACAINWVVRNNTITLNHNAGIRADYGMQIVDNQINGNGRMGILAGLPATSPSNLLISGDTVEYNNYAHVAPGWGAGGIKLGNIAGARVLNCNISYNVGHGLHFDDNSVNNVIDGNTVEFNSDPQGQGSASEGIVVEISGQAVIRNNRSRYNGTGAKSGPNWQIGIADSHDVESYCNVIEVDNNPVNQAWSIFASPRGTNQEPPNSGQPIVSTGNSFHHNTVIFDGTAGQAGYLQGDVKGQPSFFASNAPPDFNMYHASDPTARYIYDGNNSGQNTNKTFAAYQGIGADRNGTLDTAFKSGFPTVSIGLPFSATASDVSGMVGATLLIDWREAGSVTGTGPYSFPASAMTPGTHVLAVMGTAKSGVKTCQAITVSQTCNCSTIQIQP